MTKSVEKHERKYVHLPVSWLIRGGVVLGSFFMLGGYFQTLSDLNADFSQLPAIDTINLACMMFIFIGIATVAIFTSEDD